MTRTLFQRHSYIWGQTRKKAGPVLKKQLGICLRALTKYFYYVNTILLKLTGLAGEFAGREIVK